MSVSLDASTVALFASLLLATWYYSRKASRYPPGPKGWPLIGNLLDAPKPGSEWVDYHEMCKKYSSDMVYLSIFRQSVLVLDSFEAINDLLDKRSSVYSSRPRFTMLTLALFRMDWVGDFALIPYGDDWRAHRKCFQSSFSTRPGVGWYNPQQTRAAHGLLSKLLARPENWRDHVQHQIGSGILDIAYGIKTLPENDPLIDMVEDTISTTLQAMVPGRFLVDTLPWLKYVPAWVPGAGFQTVAREQKPRIRAMSSIPFEQVKREMNAGTADPSFTVQRLQEIDPNGDVPYQERVIENTGSVLFGAGSDTSVSAMMTLILAMMKHPEVQAKAHLELDTVLGAGRLPTFGDEDSLPYISAIVKESLRWEVVTPFAVPHRSTKDDEYRGFFIPAGTIVIPNSWAVLNDERIYPDPSTFNPDRFMKDGKLDPSVRDSEAAFGYGRRICPGRHVAQGTIWLNIACILACFNIGNPVDEHGNVYEPSVEYLSSIVRKPENFPCSIKPRSKDVVDMIRALSA
ncbi:cytochrome P450 [Athelia psychrophila]|uniref:Cytochrome P450 n=1 Tax=Athelia psychrophila TaxID=1759441 RepID=A0A166PV03_9AGAM|nr:cytochrome P450 [Fibularhizoctonia sp. CBS 109695]